MFVGIELKNPNKKGKASGLQKAYADAIINAGGVARYNIETIEEVDELLEEARVKRLSRKDS